MNKQITKIALLSLALLGCLRGVAADKPDAAQDAQYKFVLLKYILHDGGQTAKKSVLYLCRNSKIFTAMLVAASWDELTVGSPAPIDKNTAEQGTRCAGLLNSNENVTGLLPLLLKGGHTIDRVVELVQKGDSPTHSGFISCIRYSAQRAIETGKSEVIGGAVGKTGTPEAVLYTLKVTNKPDDK